jgi:hypothetical protein
MSINLSPAYRARLGILDQGTSALVAGDIELATLKPYHVVSFKGKTLMPTLNVYHIASFKGKTIVPTVKVYHVVEKAP